MPRFSIVVPAYNVEPHLPECLDSLMNQTFKDFEVICVNDASTDGTQAVIEQYCARDSRFRLITNAVNMHLFATRHIGVRETTGEYVTFVDGDDALTLNALEELNKILVEDPVDILQFCMDVRPEEGVELDEEAWCLARYEPRRLEGDAIARTVCYEQAEDMCTHHRMIKGDLARKVLVDLGFERNVHVSEDITEQVALMLNAETYRLVSPADYYIYNIGRGENGGEQVISGAEFGIINLAKWRCYQALMRYLDDFDMHKPGTDEAIAWRWRFGCAQTIWHWSGSVAPEDRVDAMEEFAQYWPIEWIIPSLYHFVADNIAEIAVPGSRYDFKRIVTPEQDLIINLRTLARLFPLHDRNPVKPEHQDEIWSRMADQLAECSDDGKDIPADVLMTCLAAVCLYARNEEWLADDKAQHLASVERELDDVRAKYEDISSSRSYKLSNYLATPYRAIRLRG